MNYSTKISSEQEFNEVINLLVNAYSQDPTFNNIFNSKSPRKFLELLLKYYSSCENVLIAKQDNQIKAAILWNKENSDVLALKQIISKRLICTYLKFIITTPISLMNRIVQWGNITAKHHYNEQKHHYLLMIVSAQRGGGYGRQIMEKFLRDKTIPVYLENSNQEQNNRFYSKCGFKQIGQYSMFNVVNERYLYIP